jgi:hypothetical protein
MASANACTITLLVISGRFSARTTIVLLSQTNGMNRPMNVRRVFLQKHHNGAISGDDDMPENIVTVA